MMTVRKVILQYSRKIICTPPVFFHYSDSLAWIHMLHHKYISQSSGAWWWQTVAWIIKQSKEICSDVKNLTAWNLSEPQRVNINSLPGVAISVIIRSYISVLKVTGEKPEDRNMTKLMPSIRCCIKWCYPFPHPHLLF